VEDAEYHLREGVVILLPGFAEGMVGAEKGVSKDVPVTAPAGSEPFAGQSGIFTVLVKEVKEERLPDLNDEFARGVGEGFDSLKALRERLTANLRERLEAEAEDTYRQKAVAALVEQVATLEFPPVLVEREMERMVRERARSVGQEVEKYLEMVGSSPADLQAELRPIGLERVRNSLALSRLAEAEEIKVEGAEIDAEVERMAGSSGPQAEQVRQLFSGGEGREAIRSSLMTRNTLDRLAAITGQASDIEIHAREVIRRNQVIRDILAKHTGQTQERIAQDTDRDYFMDANGAKDYGIIDEILQGSQVAAVVSGEQAKE
jgi:trigger factor